jgi:hypothetical protein
VFAIGFTKPILEKAEQVNFHAWSDSDIQLGEDWEKSISKALSGQNNYDAEIILTKLVREICRMVTDSREVTEIDAEEMEKSEEFPNVKQGWDQPHRSGPFAEGIFLTNAGVTSLIENSTMNSDRVLGLLNIFRTQKQRTWFVVTGTHFYCVLDDEKTSAGRRQIQWRIPLGETEPIRAKQRKNSIYTGLIDIGYKRNWLYSQKLHPDKNIFENTIRQMIEQASTS